jgi:predicted Fe-Mo cluster-binding NifX family protein
MVAAIRDCQILLARGMGSGAYYSMEQVGVRPVITSIANIDEAALEAAAGTIVDHKEKLH